MCRTDFAVVGNARSCGISTLCLRHISVMHYWQQIWSLIKNASFSNAVCLILLLAFCSRNVPFYCVFLEQDLGLRRVDSRRLRPVNRIRLYLYSRLRLINQKALDKHRRPSSVTLRHTHTHTHRIKSDGFMDLVGDTICVMALRSLLMCLFQAALISHLSISRETEGLTELFSLFTALSTDLLLITTRRSVCDASGFIFVRFYTKRHSQPIFVPFCIFVGWYE